MTAACQSGQQTYRRQYGGYLLSFQHLHTFLYRSAGTERRSSESDCRTMAMRRPCPRRTLSGARIFGRCRAAAGLLFIQEVSPNPTACQYDEDDSPYDPRQDGAFGSFMRIAVRHARVFRRSGSGCYRRITRVRLRSLAVVPRRGGLRTGTIRNRGGYRLRGRFVCRRVGFRLFLADG